MNDGYITIDTNLSTKNFDKQIEEVEYRLKQIDYELSNAKELKLDSRTIKEYEVEAEKLTNQLIQLKNQQDKIGKHDFSQIGKSIEKITKKVTKWALAVFGVRSAYMFVRNAINTIANSDDQLATDIDYLKRALAYTIEPIVRGIVNLMKTLMQYVQYIVKAWTGRDIFANANKSLKDANKSAKELQKSSASFDKFNKLSGGNAQSGQNSQTSVKPLEEGEAPGWVDWIAKNKDTIIEALKIIGSAIAGLKIAELLKTLGLIGTLPIWQLAAGIGLILLGIGTTIKGIVDFISDPSWENFLTVLEGISLVIAGIAILMGGWITALIALGVAIVTAVIKNWDKVKEIFSKVGTWIYDNVIKPVGDFFAGMWNGLIEGAKSAWEGIKYVFSAVAGFFKDIFTKAWQGVVKVFSVGGKIFSGIKEGILNAFKKVVNVIIDGINKVVALPFNGLNNILNTIHDLNILGLKPFDWLTWRAPVPQLPKLKVGGIVNMPGKGINYNGANIAEHGAEGVIPLTDESALEKIGNTIGKHVQVNVDFTAEIEGRVIARVLEEINRENTFARNGG